MTQQKMLDKELILKMYRLMVLSRVTEERMVEYHKQSPLPELPAAAGTVLLWGIIPALFSKNRGKSHNRKKLKKEEKSS